MNYWRATIYIIKNIRSEELMKKIYFAAKEICFERLTNICSCAKIPLSKQEKFRNRTQRRREATHSQPFVEEMKEHEVKYAALTESERQQVEALMDQFLSRKG